MALRLSSATTLVPFSSLLSSAISSANDTYFLMNSSVVIWASEIQAELANGADGTNGALLLSSATTLVPFSSLLSSAISSANVTYFLMKSSVVIWASEIQAELANGADGTNGALLLSSATTLVLFSSLLSSAISSANVTSFSMNSSAVI